jgi:hypothetical protein
LGEFEAGDVVRVEHRKHNPHCRFINGEEVGNIPWDYVSPAVTATFEYGTFNVPISILNNMKSDLDKVQRKKEYYKQRLYCKVCLGAEIDTVILPCWHVVSCGFCSKHLEKCPSCRVNIRGRVKVYLS